MTHDESMRLFKYMQGEFRKINLRFDRIDGRMDNTAKAVDTCLKQNETYTQEMLVLNHQVNRHDRWLDKLATASNRKLSA